VREGYLQGPRKQCCRFSHGRRRLKEQLQSVIWRDGNGCRYGCRCRHSAFTGEQFPVYACYNHDNQFGSRDNLWVGSSSEYLHMEPHTHLSGTIRIEYQSMSIKRIPQPFGLATQYMRAD
jgi:hypothetical protein